MTLLLHVPAEPEEVGVESQELAGREVIIEIRILRQKAQDLAGAGGEVRLAEDGDRPFIRENQPEKALDRRRLAGPVRAQVAEDLALLDGERDALEDFF